MTDRHWPIEHLTIHEMITINLSFLFFLSIFFDRKIRIGGINRKNAALLGTGPKYLPQNERDDAAMYSW